MGLGCGRWLGFIRGSFFRKGYVSGNGYVKAGIRARAGVRVLAWIRAQAGVRAYAFLYKITQCAILRYTILYYIIIRYNLAEWQKTFKNPKKNNWV